MPLVRIIRTKILEFCCCTTESSINRRIRFRVPSVGAISFIHFVELFEAFVKENGLIHIFVERSLFFYEYYNL